MSDDNGFFLVKRSLMWPGSEKWWNLKEDRARILYFCVLSRVDGAGNMDADELPAITARAKWPESELKRHLIALISANLVEEFFDKSRGKSCIRAVDHRQPQQSEAVSGEQAPKFERAQMGADARSNRVTVSSLKTGGKTDCTDVFERTRADARSAPVPNGHDIEAAYAQAKRIFRRFVGKSLGGRGRRAADWSGLVTRHGSQTILRAVEIWAREQGHEGRWMKWPLSFFLKNADEYIEAACSSPGQGGDAPPSTAESEPSQPEAYDDPPPRTPEQIAAAHAEYERTKPPGMEKIEAEANERAEYRRRNEAEARELAEIRRRNSGRD